jgi:DNA-binding LytR/AlgR family response regulator
MINCIIVDDEPQARKLLQTYLGDIPGCRVLAQCPNALEAYKALHEQPFDLLFLDIKMPAMTGMEFLKSLRKPPLTILTTAYPKYAVEGYELNVLDYLLKPISFTRLVQAVEKARERLTVRPGPILPAAEAYLYVKQESKLVKVILADILYIEGMQNYVKLHFRDNRVLVVNYTMKGLEESLLQDQFIRIHRSFIVALSAIEAISGNQIELSKTQLPLGDLYKERVMQKIGPKRLA